MASRRPLDRLEVGQGIRAFALRRILALVGSFHGVFDPLGHLAVDPRLVATNDHVIPR
jgi:hypothetical protein